MTAMTLSGTVVEVHSHWTSGGEQIVTESTIEQPDGNLVVVSQVGGSADGLGQHVYDDVPLLVRGMRVDLAAHAADDLAGVSHNVVDGVKVRFQPSAFVRTGPTTAGHPLYWESGCIFVTPDADGTKEIPGDQEFAVIDACIATWNGGTASCSYLQVKTDASAQVEVGGKDYKNVIKFRDASWCRPATHDTPAKCYSDSSAGITTATYVDDGGARDGAIVDADIEINGVNFAIGVNGTTLGAGGCLADLANTLTHELGHLHGLEHTCLASGDPARVDGDGKPVPPCSATSDPKIVDSTMYPFQDCGETKKATLAADEISAICTTYPTANGPGTCEPVGSGAGCCEVGRGRSSPLGPLALALVVGFLGLRKTRRPR
ncbi:hypothetical protein BH11MYX1_BH11MYX1_21620 [soil metagenome]